MEIKHLVSFLAIADELHFGRAAARLHLAQPSLSQQLKRLERSLNVTLVARTSHEVRLTPAGEVLRVEALRLMEQVEKATEAVQQAAAGRSGTINVGFNFPAGLCVVQPTMRWLNAQYPGLTVKLWEKRTGPQLTALAAGELDVAIVFGRAPAGQLHSRQLMTMSMVAVVGAHHPWAGRERVPFRELSQQTCVMFRREQSPAMHDAIYLLARHRGIDLNVADEVDDTGATSLVLTTRPVVGFASSVSARHVKSRGLVPVRLVDPMPTLSVHAVWRADEQHGVVGAFLEALAAAGPFRDA